MKKPELYNENHQATYCPEDDKLRLYVGRVPRDEYEALRAEGWQSTAKQDCDFSAVWTPEREDTALSYAGEILDEDTPPHERAADRAERFGGYRDTNLSRATGHADRYDAGPSAHGYQSKAAAVRSADRHDRIAGRAANCWDKAEYWQSRTAGVISHALHLSSPGVRMGRIKTLESELRLAEKSLEERRARHARIERVGADAGAFVADLMTRHPGETAEAVADSLFEYWDKMPKVGSVEDLAACCASWLASHSQPPTVEEGTRTIRHLRLRLAYENQMLEAQGGRLAHVEIEKGGTLGGKVIAKVNKSAATGRVVSVACIGPKVEGWAYQVANEPGTEYALYTFRTERMKPGTYAPPTPESLAKLAEFENARKAAQAAAKAKVPPCPLVNPTDADAERLQEAFNEADKARWEREHGRTVEGAPSYYTPPTPGAVLRMTQAEYSARSRGSYARFETRDLYGGADASEIHGWSERSQEARRLRGFPLAKVRLTGYQPHIVIVLTDKPQKPLPASVWAAPVPHAPKAETVNA